MAKIGIFYQTDTRAPIFIQFSIKRPLFITISHTIRLFLFKNSKIFHLFITTYSKSICFCVQIKLPLQSEKIAHYAHISMQ